MDKELSCMLGFLKRKLKTGGEFSKIIYFESFLLFLGTFSLNSN